MDIMVEIDGGDAYRSTDHVVNLGIRAIMVAAWMDGLTTRQTEERIMAWLLPRPEIAVQDVVVADDTVTLDLFQ